MLMAQSVVDNAELGFFNDILYFNMDVSFEGTSLLSLFDGGISLPPTTHFQNSWQMYAHLLSPKSNFRCRKICIYTHFNFKRNPHIAFTHSPREGSQSC